MAHVFCEHLSPVDESACNPKPKSVRQTGRYPFNAEHNDLANDSSLATGLFSRTNQICHSRDVCSVASEGEATELPPILDCGQHAVVIVGNVRGTGRMIGVGDREHHDASATRDGIAATAHITERKIAYIPRDKHDRI